MASNTVRKPTKRDRFNALLALDAVKADADLTAFLLHEVELLEKKSGGERKPTKTQVENEAYAEAILAYMEPNVLYQVADLTKSVPALVEADVKSQRVTPMLTALVKAGKVVRTEDKRKAYFSLA